MLFPGSVGGRVVVCWGQQLSEELPNNNSTGSEIYV